MPAEPILGEIMYFAGNYAPKGWALCNGQLLSITQNQALFVLLGTSFGGNGTQTFGLPDLRGRVGVGSVTNAPLGAPSGVEQYSLQPNEMPAHIHRVSASSTAANTSTPANNVVLGQSSGTESTGSFPVNMYSSSNSGNAAVASQMISTVGNGQQHENRQPYLTITACIATVGIFPSRN